MCGCYKIALRTVLQSAIVQTSNFKHTIPILKALHWLEISELIEYNGTAENARPDNAAPHSKGGHCETGQRGTRSNSGFTARLNRTRWTISELNPVCHDSTAALTVACSFCVQSAILSAPIRSPYSTAAGRQQQQQQQQQRGRRRGQSGAGVSSDNFRGVGIGNGSSCINFWRLLRIVPCDATCWLRADAVRICAVLWNVCYTCVNYG